MRVVQNWSEMDSLARQIEQAAQRLSSLRQDSSSAQPAEQTLPQALAELETMMEELRVAEAELHQQTEALEQARDLIERERQRYQDLFEFAPDAYLVTDVHGTIDEANRAALVMLNTDLRLLIGKPLALRVAESERRAFRIFLNRLPNQEATQAMETALILRDGARLDVAIAVTVMRDRTKQAVALRWLIRDITERKAALRTSEERFRLIVESITDYAIFTMDNDCCVTDWNTGAERILGWRADEVIGESGAIFFTAEDRARSAPEMEITQARNEGRVADERWHVRKDGSRFWASGVLMPLRDGKATGYVKILRDMTAEKQAEETHRSHQEQINEQARREAILQERNRLAREIHDTLAQGFVAMKLHLDVIEDLLGDEPDAIRPHIERARVLVRDSLAEARRSVQALRASALEQGDLTSALRALIETMTQNTSIRGEFLQHGQYRALPSDVEDELLRIGQEALTNALRHAGPTTIYVTLSFDADHLALLVQDNGRGFDPSAVGGYGLRGIRERAARLNAQLTLDTAPGKGTRLLVSVPVPAAPRKSRRRVPAPPKAV